MCDVKTRRIAKVFAEKVNGFGPLQAILVQNNRSKDYFKKLYRFFWGQKESFKIILRLIFSSFSVIIVGYCGTTSNAT